VSCHTYKAVVPILHSVGGGKRYDVSLLRAKSGTRSGREMKACTTVNLIISTPSIAAKKKEVPVEQSSKGGDLYDGGKGRKPGGNAGLEVFSFPRWLETASWEGGRHHSKRQRKGTDYHHVFHRGGGRGEKKGTSYGGVKRRRTGVFLPQWKDERGEESILETSHDLDVKGDELTRLTMPLKEIEYHKKKGSKKKRERAQLLLPPVTASSLRENHSSVQWEPGGEWGAVPHMR